MRSCDGCTACCNGTLKIFDPEYNVDVDYKKPCQNICNNGCAIYDNKPKACTDFECLWIKDQTIPDWVKPSESGLLIRCNRGYLELHSVSGITLTANVLLYAFYHAYINNLGIKCLFHNENVPQDSNRVGAIFKFADYQMGFF